LITVGLTGSSGSGKGYAGELFEKYGIKCLDTDKVSRIVCGKGQLCLEELKQNFGKEIIASDGSLDRKKMFNIAFSNSEKYALLNSITHKHILNYCRNYISERKREGDIAVIIDAPLLFESGFYHECDMIISVVSDTETKINRIMKRDGLTREDAELRLSKQKNNDFYLENSDIILYNDKSRENDFDKQVEETVFRIRSIAEGVN